MAVKINKEGRLLKTTIKAKDFVLYSELDFKLMVVAAIMMSVLNLLYLAGNIGL